MNDKQIQAEEQRWAFHNHINTLGIVTSIIALLSMFAVPLGIVGTLTLILVLWMQ